MKLHLHCYCVTLLESLNAKLFLLMLWFFDSYNRQRDCQSIGFYTLILLNVPSDINVFVVPGLTSFFLLRFFSSSMLLCENIWFIYQLRSIITSSSSCFQQIRTFSVPSCLLPYPVCLPKMLWVHHQCCHMHTLSFGQQWVLDNIQNSWQKKKKKNWPKIKSKNGQTQSQRNKNIENSWFCRVRLIRHIPRLQHCPLPNKGQRLVFPRNPSQCFS